MSESLRKKIVFGALILAIVWAYFNLREDQQAADVDRPETILPLDRQQSARIPIPEAEIARISEADWGRDPFGGVRQTRQVSGPSWILRGIIYSATSPMAYVNGQRVGVGDSVNRATVVAISKHAVTLEYQGRQFDITVRKG
ncbi:hypothetical protein GF420_04320 [candidate division GN15 bacterium]|nr:hypothetical protein [candidate division GN15 bacterium]